MKMYKHIIKLRFFKQNLFYTRKSINEDFDRFSHAPNTKHAKLRFAATKQSFVRHAKIEDFDSVCGKHIINAGRCISEI